MPSPSKTKGNGFERQIADFLTNLYGEKFIRAPGSGAYVGGKNTYRKQLLHEGQIRTFKGDIIPGESFPKLNAECKFYSDFPFHQLFSGNVKVLDTWINQCMEVADEGDFSIIFMKFNRKGIYVAFRNVVGLKPCRNFVYESEKHGTWHIMDHNLFWDLNHTIIKSLCKAN